jgi:hypothetical protein
LFIENQMKTPAPQPHAVRIVVQPPAAQSASTFPGEPPSGAEAWQVAKALCPRFVEFASQYDTKKYWPEVYERVRQEFTRPAAVAPSTHRDALLWKYGHLGKPAIPPDHERLIAQLQIRWSAVAVDLPNDPEAVYGALDRAFGGKTRFITVAFLVHLLHQTTVPIIDQHNFRAVNDLMTSVRPTWKARKRPSKYADILLVSSFMQAVLAAWRLRVPESTPSDRELDKFLMMYGKAIKRAV